MRTKLFQDGHSRLRTLTKSLALAAACLPWSVSAVDTLVSEEPTETPIAHFSGGDQEATSISWYFLNESPMRARHIAQTVQIQQEGAAKHFALKMSSNILDSLGEDANYELKVYESAERPERSFISRGVVLEQEGVLREGSGSWLVFPLAEELDLKGGYFYTFSLRFTKSGSGNRVLLRHSQGDANSSFRWHRSGRDSWVLSPLSLHYILY